MSHLIQLGSELWADPSTVVRIYRGGEHNYVAFNNNCSLTTDWPLDRVARALQLTSITGVFYDSIL